MGRARHARRERPSRSLSARRRPGAALFRSLAARALSAGALLAAAAVLALLLPAAPAQAQTTVWSATLAVKDASDYTGCDISYGSSAACNQSSVLSDSTFDHGGSSYAIYTLGIGAGTDDLYLDFHTNSAITATQRTALNALTLTVGTGATAKALAVSAATAALGGTGLKWADTGLSWSEGDTVALKLTAAPAGPKVSTIAVTSSPGADQTYGLTDKIGVTVTFDKAIVVTGTPTLKIKVGAAEKTANCARPPTGTAQRNRKLLCEYTVASGDADTDGIEVEAGKLAGTIKDSGSRDATLTYTALPAQSGHKVDGVAPTVGAPTFSSDNAASGWAKSADTITVTLDFSEEIDEDETTIGFRVGSGTETDFSFTSGTLGNKECKETNDAADVYTCEYDVAHGTNGLFKVRVSAFKDAIGNAGTAQAYNTAGVTVDTSAPLAARSFQASAGSTTVRLSWGDPSPADPTIAKWQIRQQAGANNYGNWSDIAGSSGATRSHTVTGLTNGTQYGFQLRAVDRSGNIGAPSAGATATPTSVAAVPGQLGNFRAHARHGAVWLAWTKPPAGDAVDKYQVRRKEGTGNYGAWTDIAQTSPVVQSVSTTVTGLTNGTAYTFQVRAVNARGAGAASAEVTATPVPAAPSSLRAMAQAAGAVFLSWGTPTGVTVTAYVIEVSTDGGTTWSALANATASHYTHAGTGGTTYHYRVKARYGSGQNAEDSAWTNTASATATAAGAPAEPADFTATGLDGSVRLAWSDPGDSTITGYEYQQATGGAVLGAGGWTTIANSSATTTEYTVPNLTNRTRYTFRVRAVAGSVKGVPSIGRGATPGGYATAANLQAQSDAGAVLLTWDASTDPRIVKWQVRWIGGGGTSAWADVPGGRGATSHTVTGLAVPSSGNLSFEVRAVYPGGVYGASARVNAKPSANAATGAPALPTGLRAVAGNARAMLVWDNPRDAKIARWDVRYTPKSSTDNGWTAWTDLSFAAGELAGWFGEELYRTVTGLTNGTAYRLQVRAVRGTGNNAKAGPGSAAARATPEALPAVRARAVAAKELAVDWTGGANADGTTGYTVEWALGEATLSADARRWIDDPHNHTHLVVGATVTRAVIQCPKPGVAFHVKVWRNKLNYSSGAFTGQSNVLVGEVKGMLGAQPGDVTVAPAPVSGTVSGQQLRLNFDRVLDPAATPAGGAFQVRAAGARKDVSGVEVSGETVTLGLAQAVGPGEEVTVGYTPPADSGAQLRGAGGRAAAGFEGQAVDNETPQPEPVEPPPGVTGVAVLSDAGSDATYGLGERIRVAVTFARAVTVTGSPGIAIDMDPADWGRKRAVYESGSGSPTLVFVHEVVEPNLSTRGIAVLANTLAPGGGTIRAAGTREDAALGHAGLGHDPAHKVDWRTPPEGSGPPSVTGVSVVSSPASGDTYLLGETIRIRVSFDAAVTVTGTPGLSIDMDPADWGTKRAAYAAGGGTRSLVFAHTVVEPNYSTRGIAVLANTLAPGGGAIRSAGGAAAALGHAGLGHDANHRVDWRPAVSVADARAKEGEDATIDFRVSLSRAFTGTQHRVTVDYATADGTAKAGEDYTAASGTLTFAAGETVKTVSVTVLDDAHDEGEETFMLRLANAAGARIADGEATGTVENDDPMPRAWLARFGRTVASQAVEAVTARLDGGGGDNVTLGGHQVSLDVAEAAPGGERGGPWDRVLRERGAWLRGEGHHPRVSARSMSGRELLLGSSFHLASGGDARGRAFSVWGRAAHGGFDGDEDGVRLDGEVTTGFLGADVSGGKWLAGAALSHSRGDGTFALAGAAADGPASGKGAVESSLTSVLPYARVRLSERVWVWGLAGYGAGELELTGEDRAAGGDEAETGRRTADLTMTLGAVGGRGTLVPAPEGGGFALAVDTDAFWVRTESDATEGMAGAAADATRLRLVLEASRAFPLGRGTLTPLVEAGVRYDGGDAERGAGAEAGVGIGYAHPEAGVTAEARLRGLLAHESSEYREWGASGSVRIDPGESERGLSLTVAAVAGAASSGTGRLWSSADARGLAPDGRFEAARRLDAEIGYGVGGPRGLGTVTPWAGRRVAGGGERSWRAGVRWRVAPEASLDLEGARSESAGTDPEHEVTLRWSLRW